MITLMKVIIVTAIVKIMNIRMNIALIIATKRNIFKKSNGLKKMFLFSQISKISHSLKMVMKVFLLGD